MFYKCLTCFVLVVLPIECLFKGDSCTVDHHQGICKQLTKCTHLLNEIRRSGTPMPSHMRNKLRRLGCGFDFDEPLVCCCDSGSSTAYTQKPLTSKPSDHWGSSDRWGSNDKWGSIKHGNYPYHKEPHYNAGDQDSRENGNYPYHKESHYNAGDPDSSEQGKYPYHKGPHYNAGDQDSSEHGNYPYHKGPHYNAGDEDSSEHGNYPHHKGPHYKAEDQDSSEHGNYPYHKESHYNAGDPDSSEQGKYPYHKGPHYNAGDQDSSEHGNYPYHKGPHYNAGDEDSSEHGNYPHHKGPHYKAEDQDSSEHGNYPYHKGPRYNVGDQDSSEHDNYPYHKGPHYNAGDQSNRAPSKPSGNTWASSGNQDPYNSGGGDQSNRVTSKPSSNTWGSSGNQGPYNSGGGDQNNRVTSKPSSNTWGSSGNQAPYNSGGGDQNNRVTSKPSSNTWGSSGNQAPYNSGGGDQSNWVTLKPSSNTWGSSGNQDPYNTGGGTGPNTHNGGGNVGETNNTWDSDKNTEDNSIERIPDVRYHRNLDLLPVECGAIESERIFGGNRTRLFEMPWMVLLSYDSARGTKLSCGGTLITEWYVLTAAHCISFLGTKLKLRSVLLGEYDVRRDPDCERSEGELVCAPKVQNVAVGTLIPHPNYSPQRLGDDIGLIRLAERADFTLDSMKPICLPTTPELQSENLDGLNGVVAGWGATEDGLQSPVLLSVDLPIISNRECQAIYNGSPRIDKTQLCAGGVPDKDSCGGDSGGPLLYPGRTRAVGVRYVQRGIVSYGSKRCGLGGFPGVYTRVANYMDWILDNIR